MQASGIATDAAAAGIPTRMQIAEAEKPFMVWGGPAFTEAFADGLASRHIPCIACTPAQPDDWYKARDPYVFGIDMSLSQSQTHVLEFVLKAGSSANPRHTQVTPRCSRGQRKFVFVPLERVRTPRRWPTTSRPEE